MKSKSKPTSAPPPAPRAAPKKGESVAASPRPSGRKKENPWLRDLLTAGQCLSNISYNLEQMTDYALSVSFRESFGRWRKAWDSAVHAYSLSKTSGSESAKRPPRSRKSPSPKSSPKPKSPRGRKAAK